MTRVLYPPAIAMLESIEHNDRPLRYVPLVEPVIVAGEVWVSGGASASLYDVRMEWLRLRVRSFDLRSSCQPDLRCQVSRSPCLAVRCDTFEILRQYLIGCRLVTHSGFAAACYLKNQRGCQTQSPLPKQSSWSCGFAHRSSTLSCGLVSEERGGRPQTT